MIPRSIFVLVSILFPSLFLFCCCCFLFLLLCCCGCDRAGCGSCRRCGARCSCAFVSKCSSASHCLHSRKYRVLLQLCLLKDCSSCCPFGDCSQSFVLDFGRPQIHVFFYSLLYWFVFVEFEGSIRFGCGHDLEFCRPQDLEFCLHCMHVAVRELTHRRGGATRHLLRAFQW